MSCISVNRQRGSAVSREPAAREDGHSLRYDSLRVMGRVVSSLPLDWASNTPYDSVAAADGDILVLREAWACRRRCSEARAACSRVLSGELARDRGPADRAVPLEVLGCGAGIRKQPSEISEGGGRPLADHGGALLLLASLAARFFLDSGDLLWWSGRLYARWMALIKNMSSQPSSCLARNGR